MKKGDSGRRPHKNSTPNPAGKAGLPVSLYPLSFEEAVSGLAQVKMPEPEGREAEGHTQEVSGAGRPVGTGAVPRLATEVLRKACPARFPILPLEQQDRKLRSAWVCQVDNSGNNSRGPDTVHPSGVANRRGC